MTFAGSVWYPSYEHTTQCWGLTPLEDRQLGGLVMSVPACTIYIVSGLALAGLALSRSERRAQLLESGVNGPLSDTGIVPQPLHEWQTIAAREAAG